jgi:hypothetical protein
MVLTRSQKRLQGRERTYVAAYYPRFNGVYYTVQYEDFGIRGDNISREDLPQASLLISKDLQKIVNQWNQWDKELPEAKFTKYDTFESTYGDECHYVSITICMW